jgi:hypothetical protein
MQAMADAKKEPDKMMFAGVELRSNYSMGGMWFLELTDRKDKKAMANITAILVEDDENYTLHWRIRLYMDDKVFDSKDMRMSSTNAVKKSESTREQALSKAIDVVAKWCERWKTTAHFTEYDWCSVKEFFKQLRDNPPPYINIKKAQIDPSDIPHALRKRMGNPPGSDQFKI